MLSKIGMPLVYLFFVVMLIKPVYGIAFYLAFDGLFSPQHYVPGYMDQHMGSIFLGVLTIVALLHRRDVPHSGFLLAALCFLFAGLISTLFNGLSPDETPWFSQVRMLRCVLQAVVLTTYVRTRKEFFIIIGFIIFGLYCNYVFQILQCWFGFAPPRYENLWWDPNRFSGFFFDTNALGSYSLVLALPMVYYLFKHAGKKSQRSMLGTALGLSALGIFLTISRSAFLGLMLFGGQIFFKDLKKISSVLIIVIICMSIANLAGDKWTRETVVESSGEEVELDQSSSVRFGYWQDAARLSLKNPIIGVGPGMVKAAAKKQLGERRANETHNTPLHALVEFGIAGFIPFICIAIIAWRCLGRLIRLNAPFYSEYAFYYRAGLLAYLFCSMFFSMHIVPMGWVPLILPVVLEKIQSREQQPA